MDAQPERSAAEANIAAKNPPPRCESCRLDVQWKVPDETYLLTIVADARVQVGSGMPLNAMVCTNCGFVRLYVTLV